MEMNFPTIPIADVPVDELLSSRSPHRPVVLVVDDDPIITFTQGKILAGSGLAVMTACSGAEALEIANLIPPQLLVTDLLMQGMDGLELGLEVRRIAPDCKFVMCTGLSDTAKRMEEVRRSGPEFVILPKPVHPTELLSCAFEQLGQEYIESSPKGPKSVGSAEGTHRFTAYYRFDAA